MRGSITKRGDTYSFRVDAGKDPNGKRKQIRRSGFKTEKEAQQKMNEVLYKLQQGERLHKDNVTIQDLFEKYDSVILSHSKDNTKSVYRNAFKAYMKYLQEYKLDRIKPYHLMEAYNMLLKDYSEHSYNSAVTINAALFDFAMENDFLNKNPHSRIKMKKVPKKEIDIWSEEEVERFLSSIKHDVFSHTLYGLTIHTGMRKGEIRALKWDDIDMSGCAIHVRQSLNHKFNDYSKVTGPKSESSKRIIYVSEEVIEMLKEYKKKAWHPNIHNGVFATAEGRSVSGSTYDYRLKKYIRLTGVKKIRFHDLRHTHASILIQHGVNVKIVSDRLGHSDVRITLNTYTHFDDQSKRDVADLFSSVTNFVTNQA